MNDVEIKSKISDFISKQKLTVIATVDQANNKPESACIAFAERENLELIFGTSNLSRKYQNLQKNPHVSFVIGWDPTIGTVQYEGIAQEVPLEQKDAYAQIMIAKNPRSEKFMKREDQRYFLVKPTWIRILDMSVQPDVTHEITL
ncbi:MAG: pyridoxamine 5'-phosphate oxidase family protein [Patescibacteria group bacterium]